ncbi:glycerol ether metabolic process [Coemansia spiralis]|uniref:Thioredoxin n=2 Tax=Coemansia TaxID=4863 RepID=A0A9W8G2S5_9FUNG|nr:thioredoxin-like protein [Coemansia spiralis]KAJ1992022.1 glycerol ether metabolic process [Coemansia umbellata]KAJ2621343.1 glycerol ether metabolic process [Coemansia sp. RSA 1358]KAJ2670889.1 glycerol ether metabolic process [Coemansia spiralis]
MSNTKAIAITSENQLDNILQQHSKAVIFFAARWCEPCKQMKPVFDGLAQKYLNIAFALVNFGNNSNTTQKYSIGALPTAKLVNKGKVVDQAIGPDKNQLEDAVDSLAF